MSAEIQRQIENDRARERTERYLEKLDDLPILEDYEDGFDMGWGE
ncbi:MULTISPECIES: hypothetical protein [unclassified Streptomyces]|nr:MULTISPECIES: hypothetical protein [unclassified Streptomyces]